MDWGSLNFVNQSSGRIERGSGAPILFGAQTPIHCPALCKTVMPPTLPAWISFANTIPCFWQPCWSLPVQQDWYRLTTTETSSCVALRSFSNSNYWYSSINQNSGVGHKSLSVTKDQWLTCILISQWHRGTPDFHSPWKVITVTGKESARTVCQTVPYGSCQCPMCCTVCGGFPCCKLFSEPCSAVFPDTSSSLALQH